MSSYENTYFLGNWELYDNQGTLSIEKIGETYKCAWKTNRDNTENEYLGIGILVDNKLFISRFLKEVPKGGIGIYNPIGDLRSNSALWASTQNFDTLGSGIALRGEASEDFEGNYKVRYFIKGNESPVYDLNIVKSYKSDVYSLKWSVNEELKLHGVGIADNEQMVLAWGGVEFEYEVVILKIEIDGKLNAKCALLKGSITEENYRKY